MRRVREAARQHCTQRIVTQHRGTNAVRGRHDTPRTHASRGYRGPMGDACVAPTASWHIVPQPGEVVPPGRRHHHSAWARQRIVRSRGTL